METKEFTTDIVEKIANFFADKYQTPQLAFDLVGYNSNIMLSGCCCSCGGASDTDCGCGSSGK